MTFALWPFFVGGAIFVLSLGAWAAWETLDRAEKQGVYLWDTFLSNFGMEAEDGLYHGDKD